MLTQSGYRDLQKEIDRNDNALCHPQRFTNRRTNGQSSQHLFWPWRCTRALSCGLRCSRRNRRSKPPRLFSSIRWRKSSKRAPAPPALPEQEPRPINASARNGIRVEGIQPRWILKLWFLRNPCIQPANEPGNARFSFF